MKLFNTFALAAVALGSSLVSGNPLPFVNVEIDFSVSSATTEEADDAASSTVTVLAEDMITASAVTPVLEDNPERKLQTTDLTGLDGAGYAAVLAGLNVCPTRRRLQIVTVPTECKYLKEVVPGVWLYLVNVGYKKTEFTCNPLKPGFKCFLYQFTFYAYVDPGNGVVQINVDNIDIPAIKTTIQGILQSMINTKAIIDGTLDVKVEGQTTQVEGDPHFKTWSGAWFDFMGECDMKMVHAPHFDGEGKALDVDIRTKIRYDYSFVESAAIKLGNDTLEVASYGDYFLNGVAGATMPAFVGGYPVTHFNPSKKIHIFEVAIGDDEKIVLKTFKDLVSVTVNEVEPKRFTGALGMSGSFDNFGKMIGRDGQTEVTDSTDFANEWQIRSDEPMLFHVAKGPQHPEQCKLPTVSTIEKRRRLGEGLAREKAERACAHFSAEHFENCVFDVMAVGDIEIAQAGVY